MFKMPPDMKKAIIETNCILIEKAAAQMFQANSDFIHVAAAAC